MEMKWLLFVFCIIISSVSTNWIPEDNSFNHESDESKYHVDYFLLALEWPEGICEYVNDTGRHECVISDDVKGWVLHGLWPSRFGHHSHYLGFCNRTRKFDFDKVKDMKDKLMKYWPNLFKDSKPFFLWKHEFEKHGTCAALVKGFETEHEYFTQAIQLLQKFNPFKTLEDKNITPSAEAYDSEDIIQAFGDHTCTQCSHVEDAGINVLSGLEICLSKELQLIKCPHCGRRCEGDVYYHPINFRQ